MFDSKVNWHPGMELTSAAFLNRDKDIEEAITAVLRTSVISWRVGVLPGYDYYAEGAFVGRTFEMTGMKCTAILPSGRIISVDDDLSLEMPKLADGSYYLCVGDSGRMKHFERDGVPYVRPEYELSLCSLDEIEKLDRFPIRQFTVTGGELNVNMDFIPPVLSMGSDPRIAQFLSLYTEKTGELLKHPNLVDVDCRRVMTVFNYRLKYFGLQNSTYAFAQLLMELVFTLDHFFVEELGKTVDEVPEKLLLLKADSRRVLKRFDAVSCLQWIGEYIAAQSELLDKVVVTDDRVDYDKLKREIKEDIISQVRDELYERILNDLHEKLDAELSSSLLDTLESKLAEIRPELSESLSSSLRDALYPALYDSIYKSLYDALYKPEEEVVDNFNPMI